MKKSHAVADMGFEKRHFDVKAESQLSTLRIDLVGYISSLP